MADVKRGTLIIPAQAGIQVSMIEAGLSGFRRSPE